MNVTMINELVSVTIMLDRDEALAALDDATELQRKLRQSLGDSGQLPYTKRPGRNGHGRKMTVPKGTKKGQTGRASTMTTCLRCGREIKVRGLGIHMALAHKTDIAKIAGD